jgi:hypothetical protein
MSSFFYSRELDKPCLDKHEITLRNKEAVAEFLASGNQIMTVTSGRRYRYVNPVPLSATTLARCQTTAVRKAGVVRVANLFSCSVEPSVARALTRGRGYGRRRSVYLTRSA